MKFIRLDLNSKHFNALMFYDYSLGIEKCRDFSFIIFTFLTCIIKLNFKIFHFLKKDSW